MGTGNTQCSACKVQGEDKLIGVGSWHACLSQWVCECVHMCYMLACVAVLWAVNGMCHICPLVWEIQFIHFQACAWSLESPGELFRNTDFRSQSLPGPWKSEPSSAKWEHCVLLSYQPGVICTVWELCLCRPCLEFLRKMCSDTVEATGFWSGDWTPISRLWPAYALCNPGKPVLEKSQGLTSLVKASWIWESRDVLWRDVASYVLTKVQLFGDSLFVQICSMFNIQHVFMQSVLCQAAGDEDSKINEQC